MGRGKFKGKPTGRRHFSTVEEIRAGTSAKPRGFRQEEEPSEEEEVEESSEEESEESANEKKKRELRVSLRLRILILLSQRTSRLEMWMLRKQQSSQDGRGKS